MTTNINKQTYLGERGKANILLSSTVDGVFSITLEDDGVSWEMTMCRDDAMKIARKFAEMLGVIPIYDCRSCTNNGNERECVDCHDYCNFVRYEARPQGEWINHRNDYGHNIADCSLCGKAMQWHDEDGDGVPRYCWYCGAEMKGGAK